MYSLASSHAQFNARTLKDGSSLLCQYLSHRIQSCCTALGLLCIWYLHVLFGYTFYHTVTALEEVPTTSSDPGDVGGHVQTSLEGSDELELFSILTTGLVDGDLAVLLSSGSEVLAIRRDLHPSDKVELGGHDLDVGKLVTLLVEGYDGDGVSLDVLARLRVEVDLTTVRDVEHALVGGVEDDLARGHLRVELVGDVGGGSQGTLGMQGGGRDLAKGNGVDESLVSELGDEVEVFACKVERTIGSARALRLLRERARLAVRVQSGVSRTDPGDGVSLTYELELVLSLALKLPDAVGTEVTDVEVAVLSVAIHDSTSAMSPFRVAADPLRYSPGPRYTGAGD